MLDIEDQVICLSARAESMDIYFPLSEKAYCFRYEDLTAEDKDALDSFFHYQEKIIGKELKESIKNLSKNVISDFYDLTNELIDVVVLQHIVNENEIIEKRAVTDIQLSEIYSEYIELEKKLSEKQAKLLTHVEYPLIKTLASMELEGILINKKYLEDM